MKHFASGTTVLPASSRRAAALLRDRHRSSSFSSTSASRVPFYGGMSYRKRAPLPTKKSDFEIVEPASAAMRESLKRSAKRFWIFWSSCAAVMLSAGIGWMSLRMNPSEARLPKDISPLALYSWSGYYRVAPDTAKSVTRP
jgi:hypothetical protein